MISPGVINEAIKSCEDKKLISDGYHTFGELYQHRYALFIALCKLLQLYPPWEMNTKGINVWRSKLHDDGTMFKDSFIMGIDRTGAKPITYHLPMNRWDLTDFAQTLERAPAWDGHTSDDVHQRLMILIVEIT